MPTVFYSQHVCTLAQKTISIYSNRRILRFDLLVVILLCVCVCERETRFFSDVSRANRVFKHDVDVPHTEDILRIVWATMSNEFIVSLYVHDVCREYSSVN